MPACSCIVLPAAASAPGLESPPQGLESCIASPSDSLSPQAEEETDWAEEEDEEDADEAALDADSAPVPEIHTHQAEEPDFLAQQRVAPAAGSQLTRQEAASIADQHLSDSQLAGAASPVEEEEQDDSDFPAASSSERAADLAAELAAFEEDNLWSRPPAGLMSASESAPEPPAASGTLSASQLRLLANAELLTPAIDTTSGCTQQDLVLAAEQGDFLDEATGLYNIDSDEFLEAVFRYR